MRRITLGSMLVSVAATAAATPPAAPGPTVGSKLSPVTFSDPEWHPRQFPDGTLPLLIQYEDKNAGEQNKHANKLFGAFTDHPANHGKFEFVPVADVGDYNWWPAKKYVLDNIRATCEREKVTVWIDWKGEARKVWGLTKGKSVILLLDGEGSVRFVSEGPLSEAQLKTLEAQLIGLGLSR